MRCTRCDRWALPQTVGRTPDGVLVFGWCPDCVRDAGCVEIELLVRPRASHLPSLRELERAARLVSPASDGARDRPGHRAGRARMITLVTVVLAAWGAFLLSAGAWLFLQPAEGPASPFGNGTPVLLAVGGAATMVTALALGMTGFGPALVRSRRTLRSIRWTAFLFAVAILVAGIVDHVQRRDPYLVLTVALALAVAGLALRLERRRNPRPSPSNHQATKQERPNIGR
jgi:hypothetical protein